MGVSYVNLDSTDYLAPFDFTRSPPSKLHPQTQSLLRGMSNATMYVRALKNTGIDLKALPFSNIKRKDLLEAREFLNKLGSSIEKWVEMDGEKLAQ